MPDAQDYTIVLVCASSTEGAALRVFLDETHARLTKKPAGDNNVYTLGRIGEHNVVICVLPRGQPGIGPAAAVSRDLARSFPNIRIGLLVGIAGGAPNSDRDIRLGDVVVGVAEDGNPAVFQYDQGKAEQDRNFKITTFHNQPPQVLLSAVSALQTDHEVEGITLNEAVDHALAARPNMQAKYQRPDESTDRLYNADFCHAKEAQDCGKGCGDDPSTLKQRPQRTSNNPAIFYGMIASANTVLKDAIARDELIGRKPILCFEMEAAGLMNNFPCLVIRGICDYADSHKNNKWQPYAAMVAAAYAKEIINRLEPSNVNDQVKIVNLLLAAQQHLEGIENTTAKIESRVEGVQERLKDMTEDGNLKMLPIAAGASFLSLNEENKPVCLHGTRKQLLKSILDWAYERNSKMLYVLDGRAGAGKSTISRTLAHLFQNRGVLGSTFFFKRTIADCNNISKFASTIAADLGAKVPAIATEISNTIRQDPAIYHKAAKIQFTELLLRPLSKFSTPSEKYQPLVLILDALDECSPPDVETLVGILSEISFEKVPALKIFITCRPDRQAREELQILRQHCEQFTLDQVPTEMIKHDITIFFEDQLAKIRNKFNMSADSSMQLHATWPQDAAVRQLIDMATPLFIVASTVCLFLAHRQFGPPDRQLAKILKDPNRFQATKLDFVYNTVLNQQLCGDLTDHEKITICGEFQAIIAPIVVLRNPLPVPVLSAVLNIDHGTIRHRLSFLSSVLNIPGPDNAPVTLFHLSFRDFLLDTDKRGKTFFWVDEKATHMRLAGHCLRLLQHLRRNLYSLEFLGEIDRQSINKSLRPEIQYACVNWVYHIESSETLLTDGGAVHLFLKIHFLHWLEALSLLGQDTRAVEFITALKQQVHKTHGHQIEAFLDDSIRFVQANSALLEISPLQLYSSALLFAPHQTIVRNTFEKLHIEKLTPWIKKIPRIDERWGESIQAIESGQFDIGGLSFSPNSSVFASTSPDSTKIWQIGSGRCLKTIEYTDLATFSDDSMLLAVASTEGELFIWHTACWELVTSYPSSGERIMALRFKRHSQTLVSASANCTTVWDVQGMTLQPLHHLQHELKADLVELSNDLTCVAQRVARNAVRIWNFELHMTVCCAPTEGDIQKIVFSPNDLLLATICDCPDATVVWCARTGAQMHLFEVEKILSLAFSSDSKLLVQGGIGITVWHMDTGQHIFTFDSHRDLFTSVVFSADNSLLVSASYSNAIQIWKTDNIATHTTSDVGLPVMTHTTCSPNLRYIGIESPTQPELWDIHTNCFVSKLKPCDFYFFSPDSSYVALFPVYSKLEVFFLASMQLELSFESVYKCFSPRDTNGIAFSQDSKLLLFPVRGAVEIWSISSKERMKSLEMNTEDICSTALSPNSELLATSANGKISIYSLSSKQCIRHFGVGDISLSKLLFSEDSKRIMGFEYVQRAWSVWDIERCQFLCSIESGHNLAHVARFDGDLITMNCGQVQLFATENEENAKETQPQHPIAEMSYRWRGWGLSEDKAWLTWNGIDVLWLPWYYRPCGMVVNGCELTLVCESGMVYSLELGDPGISEETS